MINKIKFYPVDTADCTLITLGNGKTILIDCQIRNPFDDQGKQIAFDVKKDILSNLKKDENGYPFVDLFINTHPHEDHCLGFADHFYHGDPKDYDSSKDNEKIIIGELWVTPCTFGNKISQSAIDIRKEAKRRRSLYDADEDYSGSFGNHLRIIGYDKDKEFDTRYSYIPGQTITNAGCSDLELLEIFIHAPFKEDIDESKKTGDKNLSSIVMQLGFKNKKTENSSCLVLLGGDAEHEVWQHILDNNSDEGKLKWDILLAPHHCSWSFFNESDNKTEIKPSADQILSYKKDDKSYIVSSSKEILDDGNNPPCYEAMKQYKNHLSNKSNFLVTATDKKVNDIPQPIVFRLNQQGISRENGTIDANEARTIGDSLKNGGLFVAKNGALTTIASNAMAVTKSRGFYGE